MSEDKATVFVVDDDPSMRRSLESLLASVGLSVSLFSSDPEFMRAVPMLLDAIHAAIERDRARRRDELGLSVVTVKVHRGQVMPKMQAKSVVELVRTADRLGISH